MLRFLTAGESHGQALTVIVEGLPAGLAITAAQIADELARRRLGFGRGPRMRLERDELTITAGVRHGRTLGSPVAVQVANTEWPKWESEMSPDPGAPSARLTKPRPGHADLAGMQKYGLDDARDVLERASARETAARVVAGTFAKCLLAQIGVRVISHVTAIGGVEAQGGGRPTPADLEAIDQSPVRCLDPEAEARMIEMIEAAGPAGDSLGGVVEIVATGVPVGLGSHVHWDRRLDGLLAGALMSIQAVKAVEVGDGLASAARKGSEAHDSIGWDPATPDYVRQTDRAGGIEGGISIGGPIRLRVAMKPLATLRRPAIATVDTVTKESAKSFVERTDVTAVPALGVVAESMTALVLAGEALRKFGGDSVTEFRRNHRSYIASLHPPAEGRHILLVGMMGAGKTSTGAALAERLGRPYVDNDREVERSVGRSVAEIFATDGEAGFREVESRVLREATAASPGAVISVAGGAVLDQANRARLTASGRVIWLRATPQTLAARVGAGEGRPLLSGSEPVEEVLARLAAQRTPMYEEVADVVIDVDELTLDEVVERICAALA